MSNRRFSVPSLAALYVYILWFAVVAVVAFYIVPCALLFIQQLRLRLPLPLLLLLLLPLLFL